MKSWRSPSPSCFEFAINVMELISQHFERILIIDYFTTQVKIFVYDRQWLISMYHNVQTVQVELENNYVREAKFIRHLMTKLLKFLNQFYKINLE